MRKMFLTLLWLFCLVPSISMAITIDYSLTDLGGATYRYDYKVTNNGSLFGGAHVKLFDIAFDTSLYDELSLTPVSGSAITANWSEIFLASTPGVPAQYDVLALGDGIGVGSSVSGFSVQFDWLGAAAGPGVQEFTIFDADSFALLETGLTSLYVQPPPVDPGGPPVPEPSTMILTAIGLAGIGLARRRMSK